MNRSQDYRRFEERRVSTVFPGGEDRSDESHPISHFVGQQFQDWDYRNRKGEEDKEKYDVAP